MSGPRRVPGRLAVRWVASLGAVGLGASSLVFMVTSPALARGPLPRPPLQRLSHAPGGPRGFTAPRHPPQGVVAPFAELANGRTGKELWGRQQGVERPIASLTKVMTALVVIRSGDLDRDITITEADVEYPGCCIAKAGLVAGDVLTARQLLYAMLLPSGADAALALADSYGPGWRAFVRKMNSTARALHMYHTHFTSFDGVRASNVSTPSNLLALGEAAMRLPAFSNVVKRKWYQLLRTRRHHYYFWRNRNQLLWSYRGAIGIKTGWIPLSGECLLFEAVRDHHVLIGVVLDSADNDQSSQSFIDAADMLDWGFSLR
jgi:D-alanyl-D-alanine carboxypeptidase (penicillin-binding protein 5/6)